MQSGEYIFLFGSTYPSISTSTNFNLFVFYSEIAEIRFGVFLKTITKDKISYYNCLFNDESAIRK